MEILGKLKSKDVKTEGFFVFHTATQISRAIVVCGETGKDECVGYLISVVWRDEQAGI